jgi:hypothetical protein
MRDRRAYLRERLGPLGLLPGREQEILAELADHLEDQCAAEGEKALLPHRRRERIEDGTNWTLLAREIRCAEEGTMSPTAKTLWVPGVSMLLCSSTLLVAMSRLVPPTSWTDSKGSLLLLSLWMLSYLVFGAVGAWWSRRAGGSAAARFFAGTFPMTFHLAVFLVAIIASMAPQLSRVLDLRPEHLQLAILLRIGLLWLVIPGVALSIGAVPFLRNTAKA